MTYSDQLNAKPILLHRLVMCSQLQRIHPCHCLHIRSYQVRSKSTPHSGTGSMYHWHRLGFRSTLKCSFDFRYSSCYCASHNKLLHQDNKTQMSYRYCHTWFHFRRMYHLAVSRSQKVDLATWLRVVSSKMLGDQYMPWKHVVQDEAPRIGGEIVNFNSGGWFCLPITKTNNHIAWERKMNHASYTSL